MKDKSAEHKTISVTLTNRPRSTISNPKQGLTGLHNFVRYQSHTYNGSPLIFWKPSGITDTRIHGSTEHSQDMYMPPLGGGHNNTEFSYQTFTCNLIHSVLWQGIEGFPLFYIPSLEKQTGARRIH